MNDIVTAMVRVTDTARKLSASYQASMDAYAEHLNALRDLALLIGFTDEPNQEERKQKPSVDDMEPVQ